MPATYADVWRSVKLHASAAPTWLIREWVNDAWKQVVKSRPTAAFLRKQGVLTFNVALTVAVTVTQGSATVTSAGLFTSATTLGRQFRVAGFPTYSVIAFVDINTITLDRPFGEASASTNGTFWDGYVVVPADWGSFDLIADPYNQRRIAFWISEDQLNILDPIRQAADSGPRLLATTAPSTVPATLGRIQFEAWPKPQAARSYPYFYYQTGQDLTDSFTFPGVVGDALQILRKGALAQCARWPGTDDKKNPYFQMGLADRLQKEFDDEVQILGLRDDDQQGSDLSRIHWERWPLADLAYNDQSLRATDASIADLY